MIEPSGFLSSFGNVLLTAFGIGLLIFVHEAGHFLCARWIGARVEVFSLGFGPRLWGWRRGATDYRLSLVPIGGYVAVAGQDPGDRRHPREHCLWSKGVGQRMLFFSGGVLMNLLFALVAFPIVFHVGVDFLAPVVGSVERGSAAWECDLRPGDRVLEAGGKKIYSFEVLGIEVALAGPRGIALKVRHAADGSESNLHVVPNYDPYSGSYSLGIGPAVESSPLRIHVDDDGAARDAGLHDGDLLLAVDGHPAWSPEAQAALSSGKPLQLEIDGSNGGAARQLTLTPRSTENTDRPMIGVRALPRRVAGIRPSLPLLQQLGLQRDDLVLSVDGHALDDRGLQTTDGATLTMDVLRDGKLLRLTAPADPAQRRELPGHVALAQATGELAVEPMPETPAARAGIRAGDRVVAIDGRPITRWEQLSEAVTGCVPGAGLRFRLLRAAEADMAGAPEACFDSDGAPLHAPTVEVDVHPSPQVTFASGFVPELVPLREEFKVEGVLATLRAGTVCAVDLTKQVYVTLKRLFTGEVAAKNLAGIITIARTSYQNAHWGPSRLFYWLALLSINLALINVLPIPVLDGGHLLFLLIERIKGSPVSTTVLNYSQILGLIFVLALVVFVTYNDILRLF